MMKVKELIAKLGEFDPEMPVLVKGYEGGFDDPGAIRVHVASPRGYESYSGKYDDPMVDSLTEYLTAPWYSDEERDGAFEAVVIPR